MSYNQIGDETAPKPATTNKAFPSPEHLAVALHVYNNRGIVEGKNKTLEVRKWHFKDQQERNPRSTRECSGCHTNICVGQHYFSNIATMPGERDVVKDLCDACMVKTLRAALGDDDEAIKREYETLKTEGRISDCVVC
eukprot:m51a1_g6160 hypothetical protein (138) ;mRNA; r:332310-333051